MNLRCEWDAHRVTAFLAVALLILGTPFSRAAASTVNFEGFPDSTILTTQVAGLSFSNSIILTAGISLNEIEFPPHSGLNVASDNNGPMAITFASPVTSVSGFVTYTTQLTFTGFGSSNNLLASAHSAFNDNLALSGDPGSSPNEFFSLTSSQGFSTFDISGAPGGSSFVLDDLTFRGAQAVPLPSSLLLFFSSVTLLLFVNVLGAGQRLHRAI